MIKELVKGQAILKGVMKCLSCKYIWVSRVKIPKECPNCKSRSWKK